MHALAGEPRCKVMLVDDDALVRRALARALQERSVEVLAEAQSGQAAIDLLSHLDPDVVVMDLSMPGMSGIEATRKIATVAPLCRVLVLTGSAEKHDVLEAILAGAVGYLLKDVAAEDLVDPIIAAADGESVISERLAGRLLEQVRNRDDGDMGESALRATLTEREIEVLRLLAGGKENSQIATELFISPKTVKNHISSILAKLQLENRIQAAVHAVRTGIV